MIDSPASMSIHEESTVVAERPVMGVFNNLVMFDQHVPQNSLASIVPDLATGWSWNEDGTELTFPLRQGVKWHDGKPFTAADVKCTWDLLTGRSSEKLRLNPRKAWYRNLERGHDQRRLRGHLPSEAAAAGAAGAARLGLVAGLSLPCAGARHAQHPIGTGPFKFVEFKPNEGIKLTRNPDYWKPGRPYLDGIEYTIMPNRSTVVLAFIAGKFDLTFAGSVTIPLMQDIKSQKPDSDLRVGPGKRQHAT